MSRTEKEAWAKNSGKLPKTENLRKEKCVKVQLPTVHMDESVASLNFKKNKDLELHCGRCKGIEGFESSCYIDTTLLTNFSMFRFNSIFDFFLLRLGEAKDVANFEEFQAVLRNEIIYPLRSYLYVNSEPVNLLFGKMLKADPFIKVSP